MTTIEDLRSTIVPKSDQLNSEQLLAGPITVTVTDVSVGSGPEQPISVHYEGENGRPYKPCKTCRKVLILAWGADGRAWSGKSMTLYCDPSVKFGGDEVGGIRISHMSDIPKNIEVSLTATRGKKALHTIKLLRVEKRPGLSAVLNAIANATNKATMDNAKGMAQLLTDDDDIKAALTAYKARAAVLKSGAAKTDDAPKATAQQFIERMDNAFDAEEAQRILAEAKEQLTAEQYAEAELSFQTAWTP